MAKRIAILLFLSSPSWGAYSIISSTCSTGSGTTVTTTGIDTTGADLILLNVVYYGAVGFAAPTSNKAGTFTALTPQSNATDASSVIYYSTNSTVGAAHTFTETSGTNFPCVCVLAVSGSLSATPFDVQNGAKSASASTLATGSVTPGVNNEIVFASLATGALGNMSIDGGFTMRDQKGYGVGNNFGCGIAYLIQTTATAANPTWTKGGAAGGMAATIASFKPSGATPTFPGSMFEVFE